MIHDEELKQQFLKNFYKSILEWLNHLPDELPEDPEEVESLKYAFVGGTFAKITKDLAKALHITNMIFEEDNVSVEDIEQFTKKLLNEISIQKVWDLKYPQNKTSNRPNLN